jgi:predicted glycosyltransferase involved in capsule biosynthesis
MYFIIIPYRNRGSHLEFFLKNTKPLIERFLDNVQIIVVEQLDKKPFNRGKLINIGVQLCSNEKEDICFTHDVDLNPSVITIEKYYMQMKPKNDEIVGIYTSCCNTLGGIIKFNRNTFYKINGFPNDYWGWGVEDKALQNRAEFLNIKIKKNILSNDVNKNNYFKIFTDNHVRTKGVNYQKYYEINYLYWDKLSNEQKLNVVKYSGINNLNYNLINDYEKNNIRFIKVNL